MTRKKRGIEANNRLTGRLFILPWEIGMVLFVIIPLVSSVIYAFSQVTIEVGGMQYDFIGLDNFKYILKSDPYYTDHLVESLTQLIYSIPILYLSIINKFPSNFDIVVNSFQFKIP